MIHRNSMITPDAGAIRIIDLVVMIRRREMKRINTESMTLIATVVLTVIGWSYLFAELASKFNSATVI
jgi:hypothetical protein